MYIRNLYDCKEINSGDNCRLREILNPLKDKLSIHYSMAHAKVAPGDTTFKHTLKTSEVYYIIEGEGLMYIDSEEKKVSAGYTVYIPPGSVQCIKNTCDKELVFLCIVDPPWKADDEEIL
jgi:mannose-6-phosphate isomerase-like protein (cupin superfamily)